LSHCLFCDEELAGNRGAHLGEGSRSGKKVRQAYDPVLGRLWDICPRCERWNPIPLEERWEAMEAWEQRVRDSGVPVVQTDELALYRVDEDEVVRVGRPPLPEWGGWRYGTRLPRWARKPSFFQRLMGTLPTPPLEGYDPYGLSGPLGGVGGTRGPSEWLASPFFERAQPLTLVFTAAPFAPECPSCGGPMLLHPWDFQKLTFRSTGGSARSKAGSLRAGRGAGSGERIGVEGDCARCGTTVVLNLRDARPGLRMGLAVLDAGSDARKVGEEAGRRLEEVGGRQLLLTGLGRLGAPLGDLGITERVALGIALDQDAEGEALEAEWREAEELISILDGELTRVPGYREFRMRVLGEDGG